jgi:hypothetical protein
MDCSAEYTLACLILEKKKAVLAALLLEEEEDAKRKRKQRLQIPRSVWNIFTEDDATDADFEAFVALLHSSGFLKFSASATQFA